MTPNNAEFHRLVSAAINSSPPPDEQLLSELSSTDQVLQIRALSVFLGGVVVLLKGQEDLITAGGDVWKVQTQGSPRRCGGQGDLLAGSLGVATHWSISRTNTSGSPGNGYIMQNRESLVEGMIPDFDRDAIIKASILSSGVVRTASRLAFSVHGRSTTTPDIIQLIGRAFSEVTE